MKVLLFVQTGDARPKVAWTGASARRSAACYQRDEARNSASSGPGDRVPRWWLVECENADAGRLVIRASQDPDYATSNAAKAYWRFNGAVGRILASGGKP